MHRLARMPSSDSAFACSQPHDFVRLQHTPLMYDNCEYEPW